MSQVNSDASPRYWRSLEALENTPEFQEMMRREFPDDDPSKVTPWTRRRFLQLMGASMALAGTTGCWRAEKIVPFVNRPDGRVPGNEQYFATGMEIGGVVHGLVATSNDGRPTKIEGNPKHPMSLGATNSWVQASVLGLYDPDRSAAVLHRSGDGMKESSWSDFELELRALRDELGSNRGKGLAILSEVSSSPTMTALRARLKARYPQAAWYEYEPISHDNERVGVRAAFGKSLRPHYDLSKADRILTLDDDLFMEHASSLVYSRQFADARMPEAGKSPRLYSVESNYTRTGAQADHRLPLKSSQIGAFLAALGAAIAADSHVTAPAAQKQGWTTGGTPTFANDKARVFLDEVAKDLASHVGHCLVTVGPSQPAEVHEAAHRLNALLGAIGATIHYTDDPRADAATNVDAIRSVADAMRGGTVDTLVVIGGNPAYDAPADLKFGELLAGVKRSIHVGHFADETALKCTWHLPRAHYLEAWNDGIAFDGTYTVCQPLIEPLYGGRSAIEMVALLAGEDVVRGYDLVRRTFRETYGSDDFGARWRRAAHDGLVEGSAMAHVSAAPKAASGAILAGARGVTIGAAGSGVEVAFVADSATFDGRFANNGWLQELPDYMTKLTWDNAAIIGYGMATELGIKTKDMLELTVGNGKLEMPAYVLPGHAEGAVTVSLGYGRKQAGRIGGDIDTGVEPVGYDTYKLRSSESMHLATGTLRKTGATAKLALTQDHFAIDEIGQKGQRDRINVLVRETTLENFEEHPEFAKHVVHHPPLESLWKEPQYDGHKWGMTIDLDKCNGCDACVVSCQAENNIPIVGKEDVLVGREMHWMRIDRYFAGDPENPQIAGQPVACHHCEMAPCEQVCPVAATVHSDEGLNDMVYNRCVGTRYCANNCPFKVRRFNFFNYHKNLKDDSNKSLTMQFNPDVTIRNRGVMEKCTFCVQRIQATKIEAKNNKRSIADGEIKTACQQACPTQAITFGDLNDESSKVAKLSTGDRSYDMLAELNLKPRLQYLARVRNLNPALSDGHNATSHSGGHGSHGGSHGGGHDSHGDGHDSHGDGAHDNGHADH